jgi:hypothetical protein
MKFKIMKFEIKEIRTTEHKKPRREKVLCFSYLIENIYIRSNELRLPSHGRFMDTRNMFIYLINLNKV